MSHSSAPLTPPFAAHEARIHDLERQNKQLLELVAEAYAILDDTTSLPAEWKAKRQAWLDRINPEGQ